MKYYLTILVTSMFVGLLPNVSVAAEPNQSVSLFTETSNILPVAERARRKWDGALVGDLDGNGYQDLILTEHAYQVLVYWNEKGQFSQGQVLIPGDMHGQGIADFDNDGSMDVFVAQGGGAGSSPRAPKVFEMSANKDISDGKLLSQFIKNRGRSVKILDANNNGQLDVFLTGFATPAQAKTGANFLYKNDGKGNFEFVKYLPFGSRLSYRAMTFDYNNDGITDIVTFGGHGLVLAKGEGDYQFTDQSQAVFGELSHIREISAMMAFDYDNDGDEDLAIARAEHQFERESYYDEEHQRYAFFSRFLTFQPEDLTIKGDFHLENLQMAFPHFDVFVGKDKTKLDLNDGKVAIGSYDEDRQGKSEFTLTPEQALGWDDTLCPKNVNVKRLPTTLKPGLYIGYIGDNVWRICSQTTSPTTGVIHNVISKPETFKDNALPVMILENQAGKFVDVTDKLGVDIDEQTTSVVAADLNNDSWMDLFFMRYGNMATENQQIIYMNNQGQSFTKMTAHGVVSKELGASGAGAEMIDYDRDGDIDLIYANERGNWHLFNNNNEMLNKHHFFGVTVGDSPSKKATAMLAKVVIKACQKQYQKYVGRTSSSAGTSLNTDIHFGLGNCNKVDDVMIQWTNGETVRYQPEVINQYTQY